MSQQLDEMVAYLSKQLEAGGQLVERKRVSKNHPHNHAGRHIDYLQDQEGNILFPVDGKYTDSPQRRSGRKIKHPKAFTKAYSLLDNHSQGHCLPVFYKDGDTFFRSLYDPQFKDHPEKDSFEHLSHEEKTRLIVPTPEEKKAVEESRTDRDVQGSALTYYQPESERLDEMVVSYQVRPAILDLRNKPHLRQFYGGQEQVQSKRVSQWDRKLEKPGPLNYQHHKLFNKKSS
ncbi:MAG: hypothetical protein ACLFO2_02210 [Candidatus Woesearchaeota archaeon]